MHYKTIVQRPVSLMLPVSAMHTPRLHLGPSRPYKPIFLLTLEIKTSNNGQNFSQGIAADDR